MADSKNQLNVNDFFAEESGTWTKVKVMGVDHYAMDGSKDINRAYAVSSPVSDENQHGIIPQTYTYDSERFPQFKGITLPAILECKVESRPGSKNKSTNHIVEIKGF